MVFGSQRDGLSEHGDRRYFLVMANRDNLLWKPDAAVLVEPIQRAFIEVVGPDALTFLQGQLSQDVSTLAIGANSWAFLLQPHGKVDALVRVTRRGDDAFVIDVDSGYGEPVEGRLRKFMLRTKAEMHVRDWAAVAIRGTDADAVQSTSKQIAADDGSGFVCDALWPAVSGVDVVGEGVHVPDSVPRLGADEYQALRIACGIPAMGSELDEKTIPNEVGFNDIAVSFNKGCYVGQELVARIDSRGNNVPRRLVGLIFDEMELPAPASVLVNTDASVKAKPYGVVTSVARSEILGCGVGLAWLRRETEGAREAHVESPAGVTDTCGLVRIVQLPIVETLI